MGSDSGRTRATPACAEFVLSRPEGGIEDGRGLSGRIARKAEKAETVMASAGPVLHTPRLTGLPPYPMAALRAMAAEASAGGADVIDLAMGDPDLPPPPHVLNAFQEALGAPGAHRYGVGGGSAALRRALAGHYARRFGVGLDPGREVLAANGAQGALSSLLLTLVGEGDGVAVMDPAYPVHLSNPVLAGGIPVLLPASPDDGFLRAFDAACRRAAPRIRAAVLGWPSAPGGEIAGPGFLAELVRAARYHGVWLIHDAANVELWLDPRAEPPPSILQAPGGREVAVELYSLTKPYNLAAWRVGFAVGNPAVLEALQRLRSHADHGHPAPVQVAAMAALEGPQDCVAELRGVYRRRCDALVGGLRDAGWDVRAPAAGFSVWAPIPGSFENLTAMDVAGRLVRGAGVACAPGSIFGPGGERHLRLTLVQPEDRLALAARRITELTRYGESPKIEGLRCLRQ